jgi:hypothetical protein
MITFYIVCLSMKTSTNAFFVDSTDSIVEKTVVMTRTTTETEEKARLKDVLALSYHSSFEALVCKQGVRIVAIAQKKQKQDAEIIRHHVDATHCRNIDS